MPCGFQTPENLLMRHCFRIVDKIYTDGVNRNWKGKLDVVAVAEEAT